MTEEWRWINEDYEPEPERGFWMVMGCVASVIGWLVVIAVIWWARS